MRLDVNVLTAKGGTRNSVQCQILIRFNIHTRQCIDCHRFGETDRQA